MATNTMGGFGGGITGGYKPPPPTRTTASLNIPPPVQKKQDTYPASILQGAQDYDEIMNRYRTAANADNGADPEYAALKAQYANLDNTPYTAAQNTYQRGPNQDAAMSNLGELSRTGGYDSAGIRDLRARGISPIRSVYANAKQDITRQKAIQGGYSPNYTAAMTKFARDESQGIADATQNVNAGIAQNVASNRLGIAPTFAGAAANEGNAMNAIGSQNVAAQNEASQFNNTRKMNSLTALTNLYAQNQAKKNQALEGMRTLYGTTPANAALYGQQAQERANMDQRERLSGGGQRPSNTQGFGGGYNAQ